MQPIGPVEQSRLAQRLAELRAEHRALDEEIARLQAVITADELAVKRMKKRKLQLRDQMERLGSALIPDEPA